MLFCERGFRKKAAQMMQFLLKSNGKDIPMNGVDWIILSANAVGIAIVFLAVSHANSPTQTVAQSDGLLEISQLN